MADWLQIQARIRKAKNAPDPLVKLSDLFQKTHDAMVAFEMGSIEEKAARIEEAVRWYTTACERFRRAEWRKKAEEALTRLGAPVPVAGAVAVERGAEHALPAHEPASAAPVFPFSSEALPQESIHESPSAAPASHEEAPGPEHKRRRRGRRGGRGRRRGPAAAPSLPQRTYAEPAAPEPHEPREPIEVRPPRDVRPQRDVRPPREMRAPEHPFEPPPPMPPARGEIVEPTSHLAERSTHGRAGEPALASRLSHLEALLRRLVSSPLHRLDEAEEAPAGPGVFMLSDSDLITHYYIEACQTLRIGLGNLARGSRGARAGGRGSRAPRTASTEGPLRGRLAEHLGISESKVSTYLQQHCLVRWLQLDEEAPHLAHFAVAVLRPALNTE
jgi:hypothetical protein